MMLGWMGEWMSETGRLVGWTDDRNLDFTLFKLNHMKLLFLLKNINI